MTTEYGKQIKHRLVELDKSQAWLIRRVREETGLFCDSGYMHKIITGQIAAPKLVQTINSILDLQNNS